MNFLLHAFNPEAKRKALHDAAKPVGPRRLSTRRNDPTQTLDIREAFWRDLQGRWARVSSQVTNTVRSGAALPIGPGNSPAGLVVASERVASFRRWLEETIASWIIGHESSWAKQYLFQASARASSRASGATDGSAPLRTPSVDLLPVWFASELKGICDATVQQVIRSVTEAILGRWSPTRAGLAVKEVIRSIGVTRSKGLVEYAITSAVSHATLDVLEARGVTHVGTIPETLPHAHTHVGDAARATKQHQHPRTGKFVTKAVAQREVRRQVSTGRFRPYRKGLTAVQPRAEEAAERLDPIGEVSVLNADDDRVCPVCLRISENGPYPINRARSLIPSHVGCRCMLIEASAAEVLKDSCPVVAP